MIRVREFPRAARQALIEAYLRLAPLDAIHDADDAVEPPLAIVERVARQAGMAGERAELAATQELARIALGRDPVALEALAALRFAWAVRNLREFAGFQRRTLVPARRTLWTHLLEADHFFREAMRARRLNALRGRRLPTALWEGLSVSHTLTS